MKLLVPAVVCVLLAGCTTYKPPPPPTPRDASLVAASMSQTWDAVIDLFATRNIPIRTIERASGLIVTDALSVGEEGNTYASCGTRNGKVLAPDRATYNVLVRCDSTLATVRTTVLWTRTADPVVTECTSTKIRLPLPMPNQISASGSSAIAGSGLNIAVTVSRKSVPIRVEIASTVKMAASTMPAL